jgi:hypothetical protein
MRTGGGFNKEKGIKALAWISYGLAVVGGAALAATFLGGWISGLVGIFPNWVAIVAFVGAFVAMAVDLFVDGIPNQMALYTAIALPSLARAVDGRLSDTVTQVSGQALAQVNNSLGVWLGTSSALAVAAVAVVASLLVARRVVAKGR